MLRLCVTILLLLGFIANQLAVVPHSHGGYSPDQQRRHDAVPHVHLFSAGHTHDHDHCGHDDAHGGAARVASASNPAAALHKPCTADDGDVVYLPSGVSSLLAAKRQGDTAAEQAKGSVCLADPHLLLVDGGRVLAPFHPPDGQARGEKLFLTLRTLRI